MTTRVPFLARLAPGAREGASGVRAALPSRFAPAEAVEAQVEQHPIAKAPDAFAESAPAVVRLRPGAPEAMETLAERAAPRPKPAFERILARPQRDPMPMSISVPLSVPAIQPIAAGRQADPDHEPAPSVMAAAHAEPARASVAVPAAAPRPRARVEVRPPLRESTVAQRSEAPRAEASPAVVHVSIDRIDLRVPAPPPPERPAAAARSRGATMPLADYLRRREGRST